MQNLRPHRHSPRFGLCLAALLTGSGLAPGQEPKLATTNAPPPNPWETTAAAGVTLAELEQLVLLMLGTSLGIALVVETLAWLHEELQ